MEYKITSCTILEHGTLLHMGELGRTKEFIPNWSGDNLKIAEEGREEGIVC